MGTGISMSSVNKIKELAESRDYSLALDILEHQDLTKSLSPQFIKICGEVYYENGRYQEARAALVKAHSMAPVGNKIIYSLIRVYLSMGFYSLANTYYEIYKFNQNEKDAGTYRIEYMLAKAERKPYKELYGILISANEKETSDIWDFEMLLLYKAMGNEEKFQSEAEMFCATYKGSSYIDKVNQLREKLYDVDKAIYCYPETEAMDDDIAQQDQRDRGIFEMTAESAGAGHTEQKTRIVKVIKSQGSTHTDIQIPIASLGCPIPPAAAPIIDSRNGQPFKMRSRQRELQKIPRRKIALIKKFHAISQP